MATLADLVADGWSWTSENHHAAQCTTDHGDLIAHVPLDGVWLVCGYPTGALKGHEKPCIQVANERLAVGVVIAEIHLEWRTEMREISRRRALDSINRFVKKD